MSLSWKLSRPQFFEKFKVIATEAKGAPASGVKPETLVHICDDGLFLWRSSNKTIVKAVCSDIWRDDTSIPATQQEFTLTSSIPFNVTNFTVRKRYSEERCLLWGSAGVAVATIPTSTGGLVAEVEVLGELIYVENSRLAIIQAKWHPIYTKEIVIVLNNDYFIRCYDLEDPSVAFSVICAGPASSIPFNYSQLSVGLSEPPVDFDFGPELPESGKWTIFILKSSGSLSYIQMRIIEATRRVHWEPEKLVSVDGVFEDVFELPTALSVSKGFPTVITIGSLSGKLYHSVLLPSDTDAHDSVNLEGALLSGETTLYVKEVLEVESEIQLNYVKLIRDPICAYRYACVHENGIHVVTMNFVPYMMSLLKGTPQDEDVDTNCNCRHVLRCEDDRKKKHILTSSTFSNSLPQKFVTITEIGETLVYDIPKYPIFQMSKHGKHGDLESTLSPASGSKSIFVVPELNTLEMVTSLLNKTVDEPYLSISEDLSPEKRETLLMDYIRVLDTENIQKQEEALVFLNSTLSFLLEKVDDLAQPLNSLAKTQALLRENSEGIAVKYEDQKEAEEVLSRRLEKVLISQQRSVPIMTDAEKAWARKLEELQEEMQHFKEQVEGLKGRIDGNPTIILPNAPVTHRGFRDPKPLLKSSELIKIKKQLLDQQRDLQELIASVQKIEASRTKN